MKVLQIKLQKALENFRQKKKKTIYEVINDEYFKQSDIEFTKECLLKHRQQFNVSHFTHVDVKKIQQICLESGLFSHIVKIKWEIVRETDTD